MPQKIETRVFDTAIVESARCREFLIEQGRKTLIRIEKITPQGDTGAGAALQRDTDGDGPGAPTAVSEGAAGSPPF